METNLQKKEHQLDGPLAQLASRTDIDPEKLEKLLDIQIQWENRQRETAFMDAFSAFQEECPIIRKNKKVNYNKTNYSYATFDEMVYTIKPILTKHGLSFAFDTAIENGMLIVKTIITHRLGHSVTYRYTTEAIGDAGAANMTQKRKSALTYAKRASLENALGLATEGDDDDAQRAADRMASEELIKRVNDLIEITGVDMETFLSYSKVKSVSELTESKAKKAILALEAKESK